ncbi:4-hydroxy-tetrahydrodipicolinate synthase [Parapedomonas caeni]
MIGGSIPALITPFRDGVIDEPTFRTLVERQIKGGSKALVPVGTTGESATLSHEEHHRVTELTIEVAAGRVPVIAGCGSNATAEAISLMQHAEKAGADAALVVCPYYNKPSQDGLYQHFKALAEASALPIIIYNIPGRSIVDMSPETMGRLAELKTIIGVKDATGNIARVSQQRATCGTGFIQLSGNDETALAFNATGGVGCISVTANVAPELCARFQAASLAGDMGTALALNDRLFPLHLALFADASPGPTKYALHKLGLLPTMEMRLPMTAPSAAACARVDAALQHAGLL